MTASWIFENGVYDRGITPEEKLVNARYYLRSLGSEVPVTVIQVNHRLPCLNSYVYNRSSSPIQAGLRYFFEANRTPTGRTADRQGRYYEPVFYLRPNVRAIKVWIVLSLKD